MTQLIVHIGTHKTGSTSIQTSLYSSIYNLKQEGIVVIRETEFPDLKSFMTLTPDSGESYVKQREFLKKMFDKNKKAHTFLLSWEGLSGDPAIGYDNTLLIARALKEISTGIKTKIIVYLRRQDTFIESLYTQTIHGGGVQSFQEYISEIDKFSFDWEKLVNSYAECFGRENIIVRSYDKQRLQNADSLLNEFGEIIHSTTLKKVPQGRATNQGYSRDTLEFARLCNSHLSPIQRSVFRNILQSSSVKRPYENYGYFTVEERKELMEKYSESNGNIAREFLKDESGQLFGEIDYEQKKYSGLSSTAAQIILMQAITEQASYYENKAPYIIRFLIRLEFFINRSLPGKLKEILRPYVNKL